MKQKTFPVGNKQLPLKFCPVIEHAKMQIMEKGIRNFTIEKLANELRISKKTIYKHFSSKEEFVESVLTYNYDDLFSKVGRVPKNLNDPLKYIYESTTTILNHTSFFNSNTVYEIKLYYPNIWRRIERFRNDLLADLISCFKEAQRIGLMRKDIQIDFLSEIIINVVQNVFQPEFFIKYPYTISEMIKPYIDLFMNGIMEPGKRFDVTALTDERT
jgi:AcrR family transcriptional regulator